MAISTKHPTERLDLRGLAIEVDEIVYSDGSIVTGVADYSTSEHLTGEHWIDGRPIYRKVIATGALPNNTTKLVAHGVVANAFISIRGYASNGALAIALPHVDTTSVANQIYLDARALEVVIVTGIDRSGFSGHIILEYVKAS